jgi:putative FmdB family regulatory protein
MPVYDYRCKDCGHDFVVIESLGAHQDREGTEPKCAKCDSANVERVITSVNIQTAKKF